VTRAVRWDLIADPRRFQKGFRDAERTAERAGRGIGRSVGRVSSALGVGLSVSALGAFATESVKTAATFDKKMRQVATVAKLPRSAIAGLRDEALDMGAKTSFSASQAGDAMLELAKGGMSAAQIKGGALASTLTLAAAGEIELGDSAGYVVKALNTFSLKADKSADVAAALAGGANASTASVGDLGLALSQAGQGAATAGLDIQETVGVLAAFADAGLESSDAGTSLKTMLARLVPSTKAARDEMKRLGLDFTDSHGRIIDIEQVAQQLQDRLGGLSQAQRIAALQTIFGSDATRAATVLMRQGEKGLDRYVRATHDRAAAEQLAKSNTEGAAGSFERLQGAIETTQIKLGTLLLPAVADAAEFMADKAVPAVDEWVNSFRQHLTPELGRVRQAWDENKGSLASLITELNSGQTEAGETADAAKSLADALVGLTRAAGEAADKGGDLADFLNKIADQASDSDKFAHKIHENVVRPIYDMGDQLLFMLGVTSRVEPAFAKVTTATSTAGQAADDHAAALAREKSAIEALSGALRDQESAELDVKQAKLNVQVAQARLTELTKQGRKGSTDYAQAQIDLRRAQINLRDRTDEYKAAQQRANAATSGAMAASQAARPSLDKLGSAAATGGKKADAARPPWRQLGDQVRDAYQAIRNRQVAITANFGWQGLQVFRSATSTGRGMFAAGGPVHGPGTETSDSIPAMLSRGEYVVNAKAVKAMGRDTMDWINAQGLAKGGPVQAAIPRFSMSGQGGFVRALEGWGGQVERVLARAQAGFESLVKRTMGSPKGSVLSFIRSTDPLPYVWGAAGPAAYDCSGLVGAVLGRHTGAGGGHGERYFTTATIRPGILGLKPGLGGTLQIGVTPGQGHMAGAYGGLRFEARSTRAGILTGAAARDPSSFARQYHFARGGAVGELVDAMTRLGVDIGGDQGKLRVLGHARVFDRGGMLPPGLSLAVNRTGRPERIPDPRGDAINYRRLAGAIVEAMGGRMVVAVDDIHQGLKGKKNRQRLPLGLD
jgi:TP901 family phage tail tape measure protein